MKKLCYLLLIGAAMLHAEKMPCGNREENSNCTPDPLPVMQKSYAATTEKVFSAMVQASAAYDIKTLSKDGCLTKFSAVRPYVKQEKQIIALGHQWPNFTVQLTVLCNELPDGKTSVIIQLRSAYPALVLPGGWEDDVDAAFINLMITGFWADLDRLLPVLLPDAEKK